MSETYQFAIYLAKILTVVLMAALYRLGGWKHKAYRRYLMPLLYFLACSAVAYFKHNFSYWLLIAMFLDSAALHKGYGKHNDKLLKKILLRFIAGSLVAIAALPYTIAYDALSLYILHCICCVSFSVLLGTFNQTAEVRLQKKLILGLVTNYFLL